MDEEGGILWPLEEGSETNPNPGFPTHTDSKNSLYLSISKLRVPGPKIRWRGTYNSLSTKFMKWHLVYFVQGFMHSLWWFQSPGIITCNSVLVPLAHAIISMLVLAPMFILLNRGGVSRSFVEMITINLVKMTLTIRLRTCEDIWWGHQYNCYTHSPCCYTYWTNY